MVKINKLDLDNTIDISGDKYPSCTHLCIEVSGYLYYVPFQDQTTIIKLDVTDGSVSTIVDKSGIISKFFHDRTNQKLYFYHSSSSVEYIDLTDDSTTALSGTLNAIEDIFVYGGYVWAIDASEDDLTIYRYNTSTTSWDDYGSVSESSNNYTDLSPDGISNPWGMCWDGSSFYVVDTNDKLAYEYDTDFSLITTHAVGESYDPYGICHDGTYFYVITDNGVLKYNSSFSLITTYDISGTGIYYAMGICYDGIYFYINDWYYGKVYRFVSDFSSSTEYDISSIGSGRPWGIEWDGTYFYVSMMNDSNIYKFDTGFNEISGTNIGIIGGNDSPRAICWDDGYFYVTDYVDTNVYQYHSDFNTEMGIVWFSIIEGGYVWLIYQYIGNDAKIYKKNLSNTNNPSIQKTLTSGLIAPILEDQRGISYDGSNILYFLMKDISDGKIYLCSFEINTTTFSKLKEYNIVLMLDRNTDTSYIEKGYSIVNYDIFEIPTRFNGNLFKIGNTSNPIKSITNNYVICLDGSDSYLLEHKDLNSDFDVIETTHEYERIGIGKMITELTYEFNEVISIFDDYDTLIFKGYVIKKIFNGYKYEYELESITKELRTTKITETYTSETVKDIMEDIIDNYGINLYYDSSIHSNLDSNTYSITFKNKDIITVFSTLMDLEDGDWYCEPDGKIYAYKLADIPSLSTNFTHELENIVSLPKIIQITTQINRVKLYGAMKDGARLIGITDDEDGQLIHGIIEYVDHYPHIDTQSELDNLAEAVLNRTGFADNPQYIDFEIENDKYHQVGKATDFSFTPYTDYGDTINCYLMKLEMDWKLNQGNVRLNTGFIDEDIEKSVDIHKTSDADEEQIDIVGAEVKSHEDLTTTAHGGLKDEDDMSSDSDEHAATQQSIKAYVDNEVDAEHSAVFRAYATSHTTGAGGSWHIIDYDAEEYDDGADFNTTNNRFVAPSDGIYHFDTCTRMDYGTWGAGETIHIALFVNGTQTATLGFIEFVDYNADTYVMFNGGCDIELKASDYVEIKFYYVGGTHYTENVQADNWFSGHRVCDS